jgi:serine protease inhibitor ecotin
MVCSLSAVEKIADRKNEVVVGRKVPADCNRTSFTGTLKRGAARRWGCPYHDRKRRRSHLDRD